MCNSFLFSLRDIHFMTSTNKITYRAASAVQKQVEKVVRALFPRARWGSHLSHYCLRCPVHRCPLVGRMDTSENVLRLYRTHRKCLLRTHLTKPSPPTCCQCEVLIQWHAPSAVLVCLEKVLKTFEGLFRFVWLMSGRAQITDHQGGRTWQAFGGGKNGHETFRQTRIYNFRDKCVVFARNLKFSNLTQ